MTTPIRLARRRLAAALMQLAYDLQDHADRAPRPLASLAAWRRGPSLQRQIEFFARVGRALDHGFGPSFPYLDLSVLHLADGERAAVLSTPDDDPALLGAYPPLLPRIVPHRYGAWVHVSDEIHDDPDEVHRIHTAGYPSLAQVLAFASRRGCLWINFDAHAEDLPELPCYGERPVPVDVGVGSRQWWVARYIPSPDLVLLALRPAARVGAALSAACAPRAQRSDGATPSSVNGEAHDRLPFRAARRR